MKCRRIEELVPLFVEGDLDAEAMNDVSLHLSDCEVCSGLVSDYSESQTWLQTYQMPEFGNAFFTDLQQSVMQEIEHRQSRPSFFRMLAGRWNGNFAYAMAILMVILVSATAFYLYSGKTKNDSPNKEISRDQQDQPKEQKQEAMQPEPQNLDHPNLKNLHPVKHQPGRLQPKGEQKSDARLPLALQQKTEPLDNITINIFDNTIENNPINLGGIESLALPLETTRMEFQTSDPNIRIIWFAPKLSSPQSIKIDTE